MNKNYQWNNEKAKINTPEYAPNRWAGIERDYEMQEVMALRGSIKIEYTLAQLGAEKLWGYLQSHDYINALGAFTGNQAVQHVKAGLKAIYLSGWQVAADANLAGEMYPDQSLYPANSVPSVVSRINNAFRRADQIQNMEKFAGEKTPDIDYFQPIIADAEAGFGGPLNGFELMKSMITAGAAGVHFEDQLASEKKCGHLGGKVLLSTSQMIRMLNAARLASDVCGVPSIIIARTDAESARLITNNNDPRDQEFITGERTEEGFYRITGGVDMGIARAISYAPYSDLIWMETSTPDLAVAKKFAEGVHKKFPGKMLAYNCSPSFNWAKFMDEAQMAKFQIELGQMGYKFQFITLAGFHSLNLISFKMAKAYKERGMAGYSEIQQAEFAEEKNGFTAVKHQREVGTSYFDAVAKAVSGGKSSTTAMKESTESAQFH